MKLGPFVCVFSFFTSVSLSQAGALIDLRPSAPGPYTPGQHVNVQVFFVSDGTDPFTIPFRGFLLDFADTSAGLAPDVNFNWHPDDLACGAACSASFPGLPNPSWASPLLMPDPSIMPTLAPGGEMIIGDIGVTVNANGVLDVINSDASDPNFGARAEFGFGSGQQPPADFPITSWRAFNDGNIELTGGRLTMNIVPEPGTLALLGMAAVARRIWKRT